MKNNPKNYPTLYPLTLLPLGIEAACNSFLDIFNRTYRNYFCYLCNTANPDPPEHWTCEAPRDQPDQSDAARYSVDLSVDLIEKIEDGVVLNCDPETQFVDLKKVKLH